MQSPIEVVNALQKLIVKSFSDDVNDNLQLYKDKHAITDMCLLLLLAIQNPQEYTAIPAESRQESFALDVIASLGVADYITASSEGKPSLKELSDKTKADEQHLNAALSSLTYHGYFKEVGNFGSQVYANNEFSNVLPTGSNLTMKDAIGLSFQMVPQEKEAIRGILRNFLHQMGLTFQTIPFDAGFAEAAIEEGLQYYGLRKEDVNTPEFRLALQGGVAMAVTTFGHLKDIRTQYWIALYTACFIVFDDLSVTDPDPLREFHTRFARAEPQKHPLLDGIASILRKASERFNPSAANLVLTSALDFITGLVLDYDHKQMKVHKSATSYPRYFRTITGMSAAYVVFIFPPHIPLDVYIQVLPNIVDYFNDVNDIFSFYKEQLVNEDTNHISLLAESNGWTKLQALQYLADFSVKGSRTAGKVLSVHPEAYEIYTQGFLPGYIGFHAAATKRYKLNDLELAI